MSLTCTPRHHGVAPVAPNGRGWRASGGRFAGPSTLAALVLGTGLAPGALATPEGACGLAARGRSLAALPRELDCLQPVHVLARVFALDFAKAVPLVEAARRDVACEGVQPQRP